MKKGYCDITLLIDRSGSMCSVREDVIGGVNTFIEDQKNSPGVATFSLIQFDDQYEVNYIAKNINEVDPLCHLSYQPRGMTAMYDAIGKTITAMGQRFSQMQEDERPEKIIFLIQTDGFENASKEYKHNTIHDMIVHQTDVYSWDFVFMGANINAKQTAVDIGVKSANAMTYAASSAGTTNVFCSVSSNLRDVRCGSKLDMSYTLKDYADQSDLGIDQ